MRQASLCLKCILRSAGILQRCGWRTMHRAFSFCEGVGGVFIPLFRALQRFAFFDVSKKLHSNTAFPSIFHTLKRGFLNNTHITAACAIYNYIVCFRKFLQLHFYIGECFASQRRSKTSRCYRAVWRVVRLSSIDLVIKQAIFYPARWHTSFYKHLHKRKKYIYSYYHTIVII